MANQMHIANYQDAPRWSCVSTEALVLCEVIKVTSGTTAGLRYATHVTAATDVQKAGEWGVALKISADPTQVTVSNVAVALGDRTVSILTGDHIVQCAAGTILELDPSILHWSLDPARSGATPAVGDSLGVHVSGGHSRLSTAATTTLSGVGTTINVAKVFSTFGTKILVQLVEDKA